MDEIDNKTKFYLKDPNYDIMQYYTIKFKKDNFDKGIKFFKLYLYFLKVKI